jgi:hypothetical protein
MSGDGQYGFLGVALGLFDISLLQAAIWARSSVPSN